MIRFASRPEITKAFDALMKHLETLRRGDVLTYDKAAKIAGIPRDSPQFRTVLEKARKRMLDTDGGRGIAWQAIPQVGYRLMPVQTQAVEAPILRERKVISQRRKARREIFGVLPEVNDGKQQAHLREEYERQQEEERKARNHARMLATLRSSPPTPRTMNGD